MNRFYNGMDGEMYPESTGDWVVYSDVREHILKLCEIILGEYPKEDFRYKLADKIENEYLNS